MALFPKHFAVILFTSMFSAFVWQLGYQTAVIFSFSFLLWFIALKKPIL